MENEFRDMSRQVGLEINGEGKVKPGERIAVDRVSLSEEAFLEVRADYEKAQSIFSQRFPHLRFKADEATVTAQPNGRLQISIPSFFVNDKENRGSSILLGVSRWQWDIDSEKLKKLSDIFLNERT